MLLEIKIVLLNILIGTSNNFGEKLQTGNIYEYIGNIYEYIDL